MNERPRRFDIDDLRERDQVSTIETILKLGLEDDVQIEDAQGTIITSRQKAAELRRRGVGDVEGDR